MQCSTALCLSCLFVIARSQRINYCGARMCGNTNAHTFCQYNPGPGPRCSGYIKAGLTNDEKSRLLARLNRRRDEAASGRLRTLPSAGNMLKLRWIEELAQEAQLWADQCRPPSNPEARDECRDMFSISVGQCVASVVGEAPGLRVESLVDTWYMQSLLYKGNVTSYVPPDIRSHFYGDFAQMLWSRSYMVGCGRSRFMVPSQGRLRSVERLVCNISPSGPAPYRALWGPAAPAAACPPRSHPDQAFASLCNYQLEMNVSDIDLKMTIEEHVLLTSVLEIERNESLFGRGMLDELYLTNLAIVTMADVDTTTKLYNSIQKRDIIEAIDVKYSNFSDIKDKHNKQRALKSSQDTNNKLTKNRFSTIGRPKTYNMADLTEIGSDQHDENYEVIEEVTKNIHEIYGEYSIVEIPEENKTTIPEVTKIESKLDDTFRESNITFKNTIDEKIVNTEGNLSSLVVITETEANSGTEYSLTDTLNETLKESQKSDDDYLTDTETVRQLQEALNNLEGEKHTQEIAVKVRRELRESTERSIKVDTTTPVEDRNTTEDRGPMLKMVLQYMPYLKGYERELLGSSVNSAACVTPSIVLVLCLCL